MEKGRKHLFSFGRSPGAALANPKLIYFAIASGLSCSIVSCSSGESFSPDAPAVAVTIPHTGGRDVPLTGTSVTVRVRAPRGEAGIRAGDWHLIRRLDLFVFNDDALRTLDAYTRSYA